MNVAVHTPPRRLLALLASALLALAPSGHVRADAGAAGRLAPVVARILSYERTLPSRAGGSVDIVVLFAPSAPDSASEGHAYTDALSRMVGSTVQGLPLRVSSVAYTPGALSSALGAGADVLVVCQGLDAQVSAIAQAARARNVLTVGLVRAHVQQATSVAVLLEDGRPKIVTHLGHARAEGMQFSSQLLRLSEVL